MGDNSHQFFFAVSGYTDFNFPLIVVFNDFRTSLVFIKNNTTFPKESLLFNPRVRLDNKTGEDAFGRAAEKFR